MAAQAMMVRMGTPAELNPLLAREHYLGVLKSASIVLVGEVDGQVVAGQVWRVTPTSRNLPNDRTWLELSRWCLTPAAGADAGSRFHARAVRELRNLVPEATTLVSYSDPSVGHTGALYRACNWGWAPTWHRLRPPPTGLGEWAPGKPQAVKDRWIFSLRNDPRRAAVLTVNDRGAMRAWAKSAPMHELDWALRSPSPDLSAWAKWLTS